MKHNIKIKEPFYRAVKSGEKTFEIRFNDRNYQKGDTLVLMPVDESAAPILTEKNLYAEISYIVSDWGLKEGYVALALKNIKEIQ